MKRGKFCGGYGHCARHRHDCLTDPSKKDTKEWRAQNPRPEKGKGKSESKGKGKRGKYVRLASTDAPDLGARNRDHAARLLECLLVVNEKDGDLCAWRRAKGGAHGDVPLACGAHGNVPLACGGVETCPLHVERMVTCLYVRPGDVHLDVLPLVDCQGWSRAAEGCGQAGCSRAVLACSDFLAWGIQIPSFCLDRPSSS